MSTKGPTSLQLPGMRLPGRGQKILVAVSGGVDSMVLLHALKALAPAQNWELSVAHFNHGLRGRASDGDEAFVEKAASAMKLPFHLGRADVQQLAKAEKISIEMAARQVRQEFFAQIACSHRIKTVALAHHADDQVELFFLRLLRGAGGTGLAGMQWLSPSPVDSRITLVRPLLDIPKVALEEFARIHRIRYREDATNLSTDFLRNRVRRELLPLLRKHYEPGLNKTILRAMDIAGAESDLVADLAREWLEPQELSRSTKGKHGAPPSFEKVSFDELPEAIQRQVLKLQIIELGLKPDFALIESIRSSPARPVAVSVNNRLSRDAMGRVSRCRPINPSFDGHTVTVMLSRPGFVVFGGVRLMWGTGRKPKQFGRSGKPPVGSESFDADLIGEKIVLRHWRAGDRFQPIGMKSAPKLQDLFINAKIPREWRHRLVLAEAANGIFWVEGLRISEKFKVGAKTRRILVWNWRRPKFDN